MKRYLLIAMIGISACHDSKDPANESRLPASIVNNPHSASGMDTVAAARKPVMEFKDTLHNFGTIKENEVAAYEFTFTNTGKTPLIISSASGSCGCTVADYPHDPILPGQAGSMKVTFNSAGKQGHQEKSVTLQTNTLRNIHMLYIQAEVEKKK
jgi:hypothetical protein